MSIQLSRTHGTGRVYDQTHLKQFGNSRWIVWVLFDHFVGLALKGLKNWPDYSEA